MPPAPPAPIASPCLQVCMVDGRTRHCIGCYRTLPEIARWSRMTDDEREAIMQALPARGEAIRAKTRAQRASATDAAN